MFSLGLPGRGAFARQRLAMSFYSLDLFVHIRNCGYCLLVVVMVADIPGKFSCISRFFFSIYRMLRQYSAAASVYSNVRTHL